MALSSGDSGGSLGPNFRDVLAQRFRTATGGNQQSGDSSMWNNILQLITNGAGAAGGGPNPFTQTMDAAPPSTPNIPGNTNGLAHMLIGPMLGDENKNPQEGNQESVDPLQALMDQLGGYNEDLQGLIGTGQESMEAALSKLQGGIGKSYNSAIDLLRQQNQGARADTKEGASEIRKMYAALRKDYKNTAGQEKRAGNRMARQLESQGENVAANINQSADQLLNQNAAVAEGLGSPEMMAELNQQVTNQAQQQGNRAIKGANRDSKQELKVAEGQRGYLNRMGSHVNLEGTNRAADLFDQLQKYLQGNRAKIGDIAGQRSAALAQAEAGMKGQFEDNTSQITQQVFDNAMQMAQLQMAMQNTQAENMAKMQEGQQQDLSKFLPEQMVNSNAILSGAPSVVQKLFPQIMDNNGIVNNDFNGMQLDNNMATLQKYLTDYLTSDRNDTGVNWNQLSPEARQSLVASIFQAIQGGTGYNPPETGSL